MSKRTSQITTALGRMQMRRDDRAANLRYYRRCGTDNKTARALCEIRGHHANLPRPILACEWPIRKCGRGVTACTHFDEFSWKRVTLLPANATEHEIDLCVVPSGSHTPGTPFAWLPHIERGPWSIRIAQRGGIDV